MSNAPKLDLSQEQQIAINCTDSNISLVAAAGSGKTTVLSYRALRLAQDGEKVLILTFSNRAAKDIKRRCQGMGIDFYTFHAFAYKHIRCGQSILSDYDIQKMLKEIILAMSLRVAKNTAQGNKSSESVDYYKGAVNLGDATKVLIPELRGWISRNRAGGYRANDIPDTVTEEYEVDTDNTRVSQHLLYKEIYSYYERYCTCINAIDFDDMQLTFYEYLLSCPSLTQYQHILVDEYQDTDQIQYEILKRLIQLTNANSFIVGDPRQSIYMFRGAKPTNLVSYVKDFNATELFLNNNYRSTFSIVSASNNVASKRYPKVVSQYDNETMETVEQSIEVYTFNNVAREANYLAAKTEELLKNDPKASIAFLFRMNRAARIFEEAMIKRNIPYKLVGITRFSDYADMRDLLSWAKLVHNPKDKPSFSRALSTLPGVGKTTVEKIGSLDNAKIMLERGEGTKRQLTIVQDFMIVFQGIRDAFKRPNKELTNEDQGTIESQGVVFGIETIQDSVGILKHYQRLEQEKNPKKYTARVGRYSLLLHSLAPIFTSLEEFLYGVLSNDPSRDKESGDDGVVTLSTIHKSKGLEYDHVFLPCWIQGVVPMMSKSSNFDEETNIAYVALTRARKKAIFSWPQMFQTDETCPSNFLETILPTSKWKYITR